MRPKYKVTGCARFVVFFVIFVPIVFFGAAYFRGENGMQIIKDYYHKVFPKHEAGTEDRDTYHPPVKTSTNADEQIQQLEKELKAAQDRIKELEDELKVKEAVIKELKK